MRFAVPALALGFVLALQASAGHTAAPDVLSPRAAQLEVAGRQALASGQTDTATDDFEAALAVDPGSRILVMDLAAAARADGLQGKAIHYYRVLLARDPDDALAIAGEGVALADKGAIAKAQGNLARLRALCGDACAPTAQLSAALMGAQARVAADNAMQAAGKTAMVNAAALNPSPTVSAN